MNESFHFVQQMKKQQILENKQLKNIVAQMGVNSLASNLYLSFVGNTHIQKKHEMFEVVDYKAYTGILANGTSYEKKFCLSKEDKSFGSYITETNTIFAKNKCKYLEYWKQEILGNATRLPFIQRETENIEKDVQVKKCICSEEDTKAWQREASRLKASFYSVIVLPMYQAISELTRQNKVLISHRMHGRMIEQNIYMDTVGNFAINYPVGLSVQNEYIESLIQNLDNKMKKVPMNGASYDLCGEELTEKFYPDEKVTDIRLNFLGNREDRKFYFLESSAEDDGQRFHMKKQRRISEIEVFFYIENRCLLFGGIHLHKSVKMS